jgi:hypothetical protein
MVLLYQLFGVCEAIYAKPLIGIWCQNKSSWYVIHFIAAINIEGFLYLDNVLQLSGQK